jgi:hypothetical protein
VFEICGKKTPLVHYKIRSEKYKSDHENFIVYVSNDKHTLQIREGNSEHGESRRNRASKTKRQRRGDVNLSSRLNSCKKNNRGNLLK